MVRQCDWSIVVLMWQIIDGGYIAMWYENSQWAITVHVCWLHVVQYLLTGVLITFFVKDLWKDYVLSIIEFFEGSQLQSVWVL